MDNPNLASGERVGSLRLWPAAHPRIYLERGETLLFSLRAWPEDPGPAPMSVTTDNPGVILGSGQEPARVDDKAAAAPTGAVNTTVRAAASGAGYWLDVKVGPIDETGVFFANLAIPDNAKDLTEAAKGKLAVTLTVVDSSLAINPPVMNLGTISITSLGNGMVQVGTLNVRKVFGSFGIASVTSSVPSLSFEVGTMVKDKNYLIRVRMDPSKVRPTDVDSSIRITTDDPKHPTLEVPLKMALVP